MDDWKDNLIKNQRDNIKIKVFQIKKESFYIHR